MRSQSLAAFALVVTLLAGCSGDPPTESMAGAEVRLAPVEVIAVQQVDRYPIREQFVGRVEARRRSQLAFEIAGTIESVAVEEGDSVEAFAELARIDTSRLAVRKSELNAELEEAEANLALADSELQRNEKLRGSGAISASNFDTAQNQFDAASARIKRITASFESVGVDENKSALKAPYAGTIAARHVDEGAVVSPNQVVLNLIESSALEIRVAMAASSVRGLERGDTLQVELGEGRVERLYIDRILPQRDAQTRTIDVIVEVPESLEIPLRDGDLATVLKTAEVEADGFFIPRDSLTESARGLWACFVAVPDPEAGAEAYRLDRRDLEILEEYADSAFVRGPVPDGAWVLSTGLQKVAAGQRVKVVNVDDGTAEPLTPLN